MSKRLTHFRLVDEIVTVYVVLRCPLIEEEILQSYLSRLSVSLESFVTGTPNQNADSEEAQKGPPKDLINSHKIEDSVDPLVIVGGTSDSEVSSAPSIYVLWKVESHLGKILYVLTYTS